MIVATRSLPLNSFESLASAWNQINEGENKGKTQFVSMFLLVYGTLQDENVHGI